MYVWYLIAWRPKNLRVLWIRIRNTARNNHILIGSEYPGTVYIQKQIKLRVLFKQFRELQPCLLS
jgi:hypothetical protein